MSALWSFEGRLGRLDYFLYSLATVLLHGMLVFFVLASPTLALIGFISLVVSKWSLFVRRAHDLDHEWTWTLLMLIPIVDLVIGIMLLFFPGTAVPNQFGAPKGWIPYGTPSYQPVLLTNPGLVQIGVDTRGVPVYGVPAAASVQPATDQHFGERRYDFGTQQSRSEDSALSANSTYATRNPKDMPSWMIAG